MPLLADPVDVALDSDNNLVIPMRHISGLAGVAQRIHIRLSMVRGEWFNDLDAGIPYFAGDGIDPALVLLGNKFFDVDLAEALFRDAISRVPGVKQITSMVIALDRSTRILSVAWKVVTIFDDAVVEDTTEVSA